MNAPLRIDTLRAVSGFAVQLYRDNPLKRFTRPNGELVRLDANSDFERFARAILIASAYREDAGLTLAFARQLEHTFAKVYEAEFPEYKATQFFPMSTEVEPGDLTFNYRMTTRTGQAAVIGGGMAKDLPTVGLAAEEWPSPVITLGCAYELNVIEEASASKANVAIQALKGNAAREAMEQLEEDIFANGYVAAGVPGVTTCLGIQQCPKLSTGTWAVQIAAATTVATPTNLAPMVACSQAIQGDLAALKQRVYTQSLGRHKVTRFVLPTNLFAMVDNVPQSPAFNGLSLLRFLETSLNCEIVDWAILLSAGSVAGSTMDTTGVGPAFNTRIIGYEAGNPEVMQLIQAQTFIQLPPQWSGLAIQVPVYSRIGGAMSIRPLGIQFLDGC